MKRAIEFISSTGKNDNISLQGVHLSGSISGKQQKIRLRQSFLNCERRAIEALYTFPLTDKSAICGFEINTDGRQLTGEIEDRDEAREMYDDAISGGHGAYLLDQNRSDVFTINVGNILPQQAAEVIIDYIEEISVADNHLRLSFPTTVSPRYMTASGVKKKLLETVADQEVVNPPHWLEVPYGITMDLRLEAGMTIKGIESPSHNIRYEQNADNSVSLTFQGQLSEMDRAIVIDIELAEFEPTATVSSGHEGEKFVMVNFLPEFDEMDEPENAEVVFLVDCSGSMEGTSIEQTRKALELCIRTLNKGDQFNICCFGSNFNFMSQENYSFERRTMQSAINYVRKIRANYGGTEIYDPLKAILKKKVKKNGQRQIIILTDGQVANEDAVIDLAKKYGKNNRIFSFGIGGGASEYLVRGLSRVTDGQSEFISEEERVEAKILRTFSRLSSPKVESVDIDWHGVDVEMSASDIGPIFEGDFLTLYGRFGSDVPKQITLKVTMAGGRQQEFSVAVEIDSRVVLDSLWAYSRLRSLADQSLNTRVSKKLRKQMCDISKRYSVMCSETSFVAVEHRSAEMQNDGLPEVREIPVELTKGWGGIIRPKKGLKTKAGQAVLRKRKSASSSMGTMSCMTQTSINLDLSDSSFMCNINPVKSSQSFSAKKFSLFGAIASLFSRKSVVQTNIYDEESDDEVVSILEADKTDEDRIFDLLASQNASGFFTGRPSKDLQVALTGKHNDEILRTIEVIGTLFNDYGEYQDLWNRAYKKAMKALGRALKLSVDGVHDLLKQQCNVSAA